MNASISLDEMGFPTKDFIELLQYHIDLHSEERFHKRVLTAIQQGDRSISVATIQNILNHHVDSIAFQNVVSALERIVCLEPLFNS
jgi:hypothetical protein